MPKQPDAAADHVLVKFSPGRTGSAVQWLQDTGGLAVHATEALSDQGWHLLRFHPGQPVEGLVRICRESPEVAFAEPDYYFYPGEWPIIPDDLKFAGQWHLQNTGQYSPWVSGADIDAPKAWYYNRWAYNYTVAVIDSGVDYNHSDLAGNMWLSPGEIPGNGIDDDGNGKVDDVRGWNFFANNANPMDGRAFLPGPDLPPRHGAEMVGPAFVSPDLSEGRRAGPAGSGLAESRRAYDRGLPAGPRRGSRRSARRGARHATPLPDPNSVPAGAAVCA